MSNDFSAIRQLYHLSGNHGFSDDEILAYKKVCENLPKVLLDYYQQLGKYEFNQCQDNLLAPDELRLSQNGEFLIFYQENQLVCVWAIAVSDLTKDNPPIYVSCDEKFTTENWQIESDTLSKFLDTMAHLQAVFALPFNNQEILFISNDEFAFIKNNFSLKPYRITHWVNVHFYGNHDDDVIYIAQDYDTCELAYASFNEQQFEKLDDLLGKLGE